MTDQVEIEKIADKNICFECIGEDYLKNQVKAQGRRRKCSYCKDTLKCIKLNDLATRVETAFEQHYVRTSNQPDSMQFMALADRESSYEWYRDGEEVVYAIMDAADLSEEAAGDVQIFLEDRHSDWDADLNGEETEFSKESHYTERQKSSGSLKWHVKWRNFEKSLKTEARFFSRSAMEVLSSVFDGIDNMIADDGRPLIANAGPTHKISALFRARTFQANDKLLEAIKRPDRDIGPPPFRYATPGRMNARGISVFYGATNPHVAIAEVRPPVGGQVVVARFDIIRPLKFLDLTALSKVAVKGSVFDPSFVDRLERREFLQSLSRRMTMPVMPDDEDFEYLPTQAIADYLSTESPVLIDGIIYPTVQTTNEGLNVVLFHKATLVEEMSLPIGTEISSDCGHSTEDGWETDYSVVEETLPNAPEDGQTDDDFSEFFDESKTISERKPTLKVCLEDVRVHHIEKVKFETIDFNVRRHRWEKRNDDPF